MVPLPAAWIIRIAWIVLVLASLPILLDYVEHVLRHSWAWYTWVFPVCVASSIGRAERRAPRTIPAIILILLGIALEIFASASGMLRLGRPGFLLAASGILEADGRLSIRRFVMMALAVPIPHALLARIGEPLLFLNFEILARTLQAAGLPAIATAEGVERPAGLVFFRAMDAGWTSAIFAFGLAWVFFEYRGSSWRRTLIGSSIGAGVGFIVHLLCTTVLFALAEPSAIEHTRIWRDVLSYGVLAGGMAWVWARHLRARPST